MLYNFYWHSIFFPKDIIFHFLKVNNRTGEIAQQIHVLPTKANNMSLIPGTHKVEGEEQFPQVVLLTSTWMQWDVYAWMYTHVYIHNLSSPTIFL